MHRLQVRAAPDAPRAMAMGLAAAARGGLHVVLASGRGSLSIASRIEKAVLPEGAGLLADALTQLSRRVSTAVMGLLGVDTSQGATPAQGDVESQFTGVGPSASDGAGEKKKKKHRKHHHSPGGDVAETRQPPSEQPAFGAHGEDPLEA